MQVDRQIVLFSFQLHQFTLILFRFMHHFQSFFILVIKVLLFSLFQELVQFLLLGFLFIDELLLLVRKFLCAESIPQNIE